MIKIIHKYAILTLLVGLSSQSFSQKKNIFHDRSFWKGQPSLNEVKQKVKEGHSPTEMTPFHFDAIGYAILENNPLPTIIYLLGQGNDVNKFTHDGRNYLGWAAYKGNLELMKYFVAKGANKDLIDQHGYSIFMFAASTGQENQAVYDYMIDELGFDVASERDRYGRNALLAYAARTKNGAQISYFIDKGLDIHSVDAKGNGLFHYAVQTGNKEFVEGIVKNYKVSTKKNKETNENAILFATRRSSRSGESTVEFYQYLEKAYQLDPALVAKDGNTTLHNLATRAKDLAVFEYFISKGVDVNQLDEKGNNALIYASSRGKKEVVEFLASKTNDINVSNKEGITCLTQAIQSNSIEVVKLLTEKGADAEVIDKKGYDLGYHLVNAYSGDIEKFNEKMNFLVSIGYRPANKQSDGSTLLHTAIKKKDVALLKTIVNMGVEINAKDESGQTALHHAAMQVEDEAILKYLVDAGADKALMTEFDESAYELANSNELLTEKDIAFLKTGNE